MFVITFCFVYITYGKQSNLAIKFIFPWVIKKRNNKCNCKYV